MAGIPEHLLKRAQEARDKAAGKTPTADGATASPNVLVKVEEKNWLRALQLRLLLRLQILHMLLRPIRARRFHFGLWLL